MPQARILLLALLCLVHGALSKPVLTPYPRLVARKEACAADYDACGTAVIAPVGNLPCCSESFYCYTQGPYFSQCRPTHELLRRPAPTVARRPLCGLDYGVCAAGAGPDSSISCCTKGFQCVLTTPLYWQCLPRGETAPSQSRFWYELIPSWLDALRGREDVRRRDGVMYSFQPAAWGITQRRGVVVRPVVSYDKVKHLVFRNGSLRTTRPRAGSCVTAVLPYLDQREKEEVQKSLDQALPGVRAGLVADRLHIAPAEGRECDIAELAVTLAAFPQVLRVEVRERGES